MPGIIGERVYRLINSENKTLVSQKEFIEGASKLFNSNFDENLDLIFKLADFDNDGFITPEDIRIILSHVPVAQILQDTHVESRKEGQYTASGGG